MGYAPADAANIAVRAILKAAGNDLDREKGQSLADKRAISDNVKLGLDLRQLMRQFVLPLNC